MFSICVSCSASDWILSEYLLTCMDMSDSHEAMHRVKGLEARNLDHSSVQLAYYSKLL